MAEYYVKRRDSTLKHASYAPTKKDHKYVARIPTGKSKDGNPVYRYFYSSEEYKAYLDQKKAAEEENSKTKFSLKNIGDSISKGISDAKTQFKTKTSEFIEKVGNTLETEVPRRMNESINAIKDFAFELYDDKNNIYDVKSINYKEKLQKIAETDEWKAIVKSGNPEYVKKNSDGTTTYLIDDYLAKKKHPIVDVLDDIASCREVSINKLNKDAITSGIKEQVISYITIGMIGFGAVAKALVGKSKLAQGSYDDEIENMVATVNNGAKYVNDTLGVASKTVTKDDIQNTIQLIQNTKDTVNSQTNNGQIDANKVMEAVDIVMNSSSSSDLKNADKILANLSEDEIVMLNAILNKTIH